MTSSRDREANRITARIGRYAKVGSNMSGIAAKLAAGKLFGWDQDPAKNATAIAESLGELKGPLMKVAQLLSTIPDAVPPEYAAELASLQANAPPMGWAFVKRRMRAELGADWESRFGNFEKEPAAAASLGQVHRAHDLAGNRLACKLQYPDMDSAVEADLTQFGMLLALHRRFRPAIETSEIAKEVGARLREELDYRREARHAALYANVFSEDAEIRVPVICEELSTRRLLSMSWLEGRPLLAYRQEKLEVRNKIAKIMFKAWWHPFAHYGVIHGDPHLGNYTIFEDGTEPAGVNLLDYGCVRVFPPDFVQGVVDLYHGLLEGDQARVVAAYEIWGFEGLNKDLIETLNIWASFIFGPLLSDRTRTIADGVSPASYGRREAFKVHQSLKELGPVKIPRYFVFMDRAAIGLGSVFLHLRAELNFHQLFNAQIDGFEKQTLIDRQSNQLKLCGLSSQE
ncbi:AarF/ABC1/UbiB kinase family protein [Pseudovibrio sp. Tun.PSC04-5.I4]|uniref:ABC1 kinase family protein n=1 Tax=Pseudovibrio sp. Tun.PSC04-5.I4 TaxID=1798213 RepID=UPI000882C88C|nr:AarF/ABC1/UbiB kinase family protein [Pseudovibrio sp. Tun.PSC04-5.I4]SDR32381.1 Predicted unusual protein kinase regulating ubiquinone biosynthesis, AarF/ABC1/UbiB family [Pseudovibrio sp. Tun.PSC04-5.I4]